MFEQLIVLNPIEIGGLLSGVAYVILAARENVWCWPVGLVNVILFIFLNIEATLYADVGLQVVYLLLTFYGWYNWLKKTDAPTQHLPITLTKRNQWAAIIIFTTLTTGLLTFLLSRFTDTDVPFWDALLTSLSLVATWMVAVKKLENWLVWFVADIMYVGLYYYKGYFLLALLFGIYVVISVNGYLHWEQNRQKQALV